MKAQGQIKINKKSLERWMDGASTNESGFARLIGEHPANFNKMVSGKVEPSKAVIKKMLDMTNFPMESLFYYDSYPTRSYTNFIIIFTMIFFGFFTQHSVAQEINLEVIKHIESSGNPNAVSHKGCIGLYQIREIAFQDFKNYHPKNNWVFEDLFDPKKNETVAKWMWEKRIPQFIRHYKLPDNLAVKIAIYNWGIGNVVKWHKRGGEFDNLPRETRNYYKKYVRLSK